MKFRPMYNLLKKEMRKETELEMASSRLGYCSGFWSAADAESDNTGLLSR